MFICISNQYRTYPSQSNSLATHSQHRFLFMRCLIVDPDLIRLQPKKQVENKAAQAATLQPTRLNREHLLFTAASRLRSQGFYYSVLPCHLLGDDDRFISSVRSTDPATFSAPAYIAAPLLPIALRDAALAAAHLQRIQHRSTDAQEPISRVFATAGSGPGMDGRTTSLFAYLTFCGGVQLMLTE